MGDMFDEVSKMRLQELDLLLAPKFEIMLRAMQLLLVAFYFVGIIHQQDMSINRLTEGAPWSLFDIPGPTRIKY